jgi:hypothetical protein
MKKADFNFKIIGDTVYLSMDEFLKLLKYLKAKKADIELEKPNERVRRAIK